MQCRFAIVVLAVTLLAGCRVAEAPSYDVGRMVLPRGHAETGRAVFVKLGCGSCHEVAWETELPPPTAAVSGPVFDRRLTALTAGYLATSIAAPSYHVAQPYREYVSGGLSPMADYTGAVTVRDLVDLVAYLKQQGGQSRPSTEVPIDRARFPHHI